MCTPVAAAWVMAAGTVAQGYQARQKGQYDNKIAQYNARVLENDAVKARNIGTEKENDHRKMVAQLMAQQKAALGASGVVTGTGSAGQLLTETGEIGEIDALRIRRTTGEQVESLTEQAEVTRSQGEAARKSGSRAFTTSIFMAAGSLLGAGAFSGTGSAGAQGSTVASKWYTPQSAAVATPFTGSSYRPVGAPLQ